MAGIKYAPDGRPYVDTERGPSFISPAAFGKPIGGNAETGWHSGAQWNQNTGQAENPFKWGKAITLGTAAGLGGAAFSAFGGFGSAAAPSAAAAQGGAVAPSVAPAVVNAAAGGAGGHVGGISLGKLLGAPFMGDVVKGGFGLVGARQAGKSANQALDYQRQSDDRTYALEVAREAQAQKQWEAQQAAQAQQWALQEEDRRYQREQSDYSRRVGDEDRTRRIGLEDAKEARAVPYRAASQAALARLGDLLGMGLAPGAWLSPSQVGRR